MRLVKLRGLELRDSMILDAAVAGHRPRVDGSHVVHRRSEETDEAGPDERLVVAVGEPAVVPEGQGLGTRVADVLQQGPQSPREHHVRLHALQLLGAERGVVDGVAHDARAEEVAHAGRRLQPPRAPEASWVDPAMCGVVTTWGRRTRRASRGGSTWKTSSPAPPMAPRSIASARASSSMRAPRAVWTMRADGLQRRQPLGREQRPGVRGRHVQGDEVGGPAKLVQLQELDVEVGGDLARDEGVVRDAAHAERVGAVHRPRGRCGRGRRRRGSSRAPRPP